ncbi:MAG: hypothetical protein V4489_08590 [Chlamydiota bacterium]
MQFPIIQSLSFVLSAPTCLDIKINKTQLGNLAMILGSWMCLSKIVASSLGSCAVNTLRTTFSLGVSLRDPISSENGGRGHAKAA